jgi:hypothetical protein
MPKLGIFKETHTVNQSTAALLCTVSMHIRLYYARVGALQSIASRLIYLRFIHHSVLDSGHAVLTAAAVLIASRLIYLRFIDHSVLNALLCSSSSSSYAVLCCAVLCCAVLCCAVSVLPSAVLWLCLPPRPPLVR